MNSRNKATLVPPSFFFQAEDGIRDIGVTGVQTCALPILLDALAAFAPPPRAQSADTRRVDAEEPQMTAFVFKIQANMDPNHRDRIAFARLCSGKLTRGMKAKQVRTGKFMTLNTPHFFFAQDRALAE